MDGASYEAHLQRFAQVKRIYSMLLWGFLPVGFLTGTLAMLMGRYLGLDIYPAVRAFMVLWMISMVIATVWLSLFRCPRCHEPFSGTWWEKADFDAPRCVHCGLPKAPAIR